MASMTRATLFVNFWFAVDFSFFFFCLHHWWWALFHPSQAASIVSTKTFNTRCGADDFVHLYIKFIWMRTRNGKRRVIRICREHWTINAPSVRNEIKLHSLFFSHLFLLLSFIILIVLNVFLISTFLRSTASFLFASFFLECYFGICFYLSAFIFNWILWVTFGQLFDWVYSVSGKQWLLYERKNLKIRLQFATKLIRYIVLFERNIIQWRKREITVNKCAHTKNKDRKKKDRKENHHLNWIERIEYSTLLSVSCIFSHFDLIFRAENFNLFAFWLSSL